MDDAAAPPSSSDRPFSPDIENNLAPFPHVVGTPEEIRWMRRALRLAERGFTPPNPMVGCVLVRDGIAVGEGWHPYAGQPHAEVFALRAAGEKAYGATAYVSLEPCFHFGRTPPCADALIAAKVRRVVVATPDPNPKVSGRGLAKLQAAGIEVVLGVLEAPAQRLNEAFLHYQRTGIPFVTLKAAMTLDGKIATRTGDSRWITGPRARRYVHLQRARSGAIMVGIGTLLADDAQLTARLPGVALPRQPLRVVVDSHLRTPPDCAAVRLATPEAPLLIATRESVDSERARALLQDGVEIVNFRSDATGRVDLGALVTELGRRQIISIWVEGGGELHASLLQAGLAHKALFFIAPKLLGGKDAPTPVEGIGPNLMAEALPLESLTLHRFGPDIALEGRIVPDRGLKNLNGRP
ncbi:MAG: riboflavin biosynthesis protein RibD [Chthonomonadaceae bacterium]|nr:riboflavin biosynthesis protein RibD [Chthonomonadaceae bacterium]